MYEFRGSALKCGELYGDSQRELIPGFFHMETPPTPERLKYAAKCWEVLQDWNKPVADITRGAAKGSGRSVEELTLLMLHEELIHTRNSTAFAVNAAAATDHNPILGQNWDWHAKLFPWPSILHFRCDAMPELLTYSYPGLWAAAGINEHGVSVVWSGAGYTPKVEPIVGIPTYALIAGILTCKSTGEAIEMIADTPHAGCFIFLLADSRNDVRVVDGMPAHAVAVRCNDVVGRANHFECELTVKESKQVLGESSADSSTVARAARIQALLKHYNGIVSRIAVEAMLRDEVGEPGQTVCQSPTQSRANMTVDSFYFRPVHREMWLARGAPSDHEYVRYGPLTAGVRGRNGHFPFSNCHLLLC